MPPRPIRRGIALFAAFVLGGSACAQTAPAEPAGRPKVCLVLSGGGARGAAHVGVLKVMHELRVPVDCVVGTSMGAIVGAAYASGIELGKMESTLGTLTSRKLFQDKPPRRERSVHLKKEDADNLAPPEVGVGAGGVLLPRGLVSGVQLEGVLRGLTKYGGFQHFDTLPIPYRAVATDLLTGKATVLGEGELAEAMRASMSVPGVIDPLRLNGRMLVDGGLTNNLPVDVARAMGAEVVIAVNVGTPLLGAEGLGSIVGVAQQMINILTEQNVQASLASLRPGDVLVVPKLDGFSASDFDNLRQPVPIGEAAARAVQEQLARYSVSPQAYAAWEARRTGGTPPAGIVVDAIRFENLQRVNPAVALRSLETRVGEPLDREVLDRDMQRLFGTGDFEHVSYALLEEPGRRVLSVDAIEKTWGPNYLRLGLGLSTDLAGDAFFNLLARYRMTWLNRLGGEWRWEAQVGRTQRLATEFHQPLHERQAFFVAPRLGYERRTVPVYAGAQRVATYDVSERMVGVHLGVQATRWGELRLGYERTSEHTRLDTGVPLVVPGAPEQDTGAVTLSGLVDQLDDLNFPRAGYAARFELRAARPDFGGDTRYSRGLFSGSLVHSFGENTFAFGVRVGSNLGSDPLPVTQLFQWGGLMQQSGYPTGGLLGEDLRFARLVYTRRLARFSLLDGVYGGASLEVGRMGKPLVPGNDTGTIRSAALMLGVDTPLGPLYLGYGRASGGHDSLYLFLGRP